MKKGESKKKNAKMQKEKRKSEKKEECIMDYCCNPQCICVWGNSDFPTPLRKK
jgi:succinate dehydrogenase/fumarate reductase-like Fe-S protein